MKRERATAMSSIHLNGAPIEASVRRYVNASCDVDDYVWISLRAHGAAMSICQNADVPTLRQNAQAFAEIADELWGMVRELEGTSC